MHESLSITVTKHYYHLTIEELAEKLKTLKDDCIIDWSIEKDFDCDVDGYKEFNGRYNLSITSSIGGIKPEEFDKRAKWCYENILNNM